MDSNELGQTEDSRPISEEIPSSGLGEAMGRRESLYWLKGFEFFTQAKCPVCHYTLIAAPPKYNFSCLCKGYES